MNPSLEVEILRRVRAHAPDTTVVCMSRRAGPTMLADRVVELPARAAAAAASPRKDSHAAMSDVMPQNPTLAKIVAALEYITESPVVSESLVTDSAPPRLFAVVRPFVRYIAAALVGLVVLTLGQLSPDVLFGAVAEVAEEGNTGQIVVRALALVVIGGLGALGSYVYLVQAQKFSQGVVYTMRRRVFQRLSRLGIDFYDRELPGHVATRVVSDLDRLLNFFQQNMFLLMQGIALFLVAVTLITVIMPERAPILLVFTALVVVVTCVQVPLSMRALNRVRDQLGHVAGTFEEDFTARHEIRKFAAVDKQTRRFRKTSWTLRQARRLSTSIRTSTPSCSAGAPRCSRC